MSKLNAHAPWPICQQCQWWTSDTNSKTDLMAQSLGQAKKGNDWMSLIFFWLGKSLQNPNASPVWSPWKNISKKGLAQVYCETFKSKFQSVQPAVYVVWRRQHWTIANMKLPLALNGWTPTPFFFTGFFIPEASALNHRHRSLLSQPTGTSPKISIARQWRFSGWRCLDSAKRAQESRAQKIVINITVTNKFSHNLIVLNHIQPRSGLHWIDTGYSTLYLIVFIYIYYSFSLGFGKFPVIWPWTCTCVQLWI